ncbi:MAG: NAD(P)-dependent oxidoreductase [Paeniclostridium sordellii]|uniref:NAD(P)-dependent oxidoreductase n=1 Tax=Paeniclostridium hominis TaxID=2764329 RepID=A0ABR7K448_9FIRM|nr:MULTISPECIES: NAD(P)-dependent oxidoreductase [Paeniclostridium]MBC6003816.1 NAD(P)-dependent oxidoreductase [Paeniclostridium hominis]MDU2592526.1 NAD(P)-dependent oxidoreductase [Paeniclostridium sordellii]
MKTALVTGASGWIGLELVNKLLVDGYTVKAMSRRNNASLNNLSKEYKERLKIFQGDMIDIENWESELENTDCLYHLAAKVHTKPKNKEEENEFYLINRDATNKLFDLSIKYSIKKVVFVSTVAVYGKSQDNVISTKTTRNPITPYARSKNEAEAYANKLYREKKLPVSIVQPVVVYGGNDRGNFKKLYNLAQKGLLVQFGNGLNRKSTIYYKDLAQMMKTIGESDKAIGNTYICGTESLSYETIIKKFEKDIARAKIIKIPNRISRLAIKCGNIVPINKIKNISGNIDVLMTDNTYDFKDSLDFIDTDEVNEFNKWDCISEYGK